MHHDAASNLPGIVEKVIKPIIQGEAEKVQIAFQGGDDPNQKIRIVNILVDARGEAVFLKTGAPCKSSSDRSRKTQLSNSDRSISIARIIRRLSSSPQAWNLPAKDDGPSTGI
jgi:hypothetical protein